jgi:glycosyltransferase involved in cell wall biosynthesis
VSQNYEVDVLLATYNGEKYIEDFLSSLLKQKNCKINLYISDDGSTDSTIPLLLRYQDEFNEFRLMQGPELGPMLNFFNLLRASKGKYIALADQDDIWMENHLHASLQRISKFESPALTFSSVAQFMCCPSHSEIWPNQKNQLEFPNIFFEMFAASGYLIVLLFSILEAAIVLALLQFRKWLKRLDANSLLAISNESEYFVTAGRSLKTGVVSNAIVAQWTWAATLLQRFDSTQLH